MIYWGRYAVSTSSIYSLSLSLALLVFIFQVRIAPDDAVVGSGYQVGLKK